MIKVYWFPTLIRNKSVADRSDIHITHFAPEPAFKYFVEKYKNAEYLRCPAFADYLKNTYIIRSPYDLGIMMDPEKKVAFTDRYSQDFYDDNIRATFDDDIPILHLPPRMVLIPESKKSVMLTCLPMMIDPGSLCVVPGTFDISKWIRPIEFTVQTHDLKKVDIKRGQPLMMIKLTTEDNDVVKLEQRVTDIDVLNAVDACVHVKFTTPAQNLRSLYKMGEGYISRMRKLILRNHGD